MEIAVAQGLDPQTVRAALADEVERDRVLSEAEEAHTLGISGVPFFNFERRYTLSGAQPIETILEVMHKLLEERQGGER